jgi:hypothetical protein
MTRALIILLAAAAGLDGQTGRICAVVVQDRSKVPASTSGLDDAISGAIAKHGIEVVNVNFDPPADVEYAARVKGCSHILYTDIVRAKENAGSPACRLFKRMIAADRTATMTAEIEFRLFRLDEVLPLVSTSATGKFTGRRLSPHVSSRVVELYQAPAPRLAPVSARNAALEKAFMRQAKILRSCILTGSCTRASSQPGL